MKDRHSHLTRSAVAALIALATFTVSCHEADEPTAPPVQAARSGGNGDPTVTSVVPDSSKRGVTLDITVNGSGFDRGSVAELERQGVPAPGITTNATTYVTSRKLIANITIAAGADTGKYDVAVTTTGGRKGVGIELFTVTYQLDELGVIGGTWSRAHAINDRGEVVGASCTSDCLGTAFYWTDHGGLEDLGTLPGYSRSAAYAINSRSQVFGVVECRGSDPGCGGVYQTTLVRWDRVGGSWTITPVEGCSVQLPLADEKFLINNNDQCVRRTSAATLSVQMLSGGAVVNEEPLPSLYPGGNQWANAISDAPMVAGFAIRDMSSPAEPVVWHRNAAGAWMVLRLALPDNDSRGRATDISEPDAAGHVRVSGFTESTSAGRRGPTSRAARWTLEGDGFGGWRLASTEVLANAKQNGTTVNAWGSAVNNAGVIVGISGSTLYSGNPVIWPVSGGIKTLPTLLGSGEGRALDINYQGWIVGAVWDKANGCNRAAIWRLR